MKNTIKLLLAGFIVTNLLLNMSFADKETFSENHEVQLEKIPQEERENVSTDLEEKNIKFDEEHEPNNSSNNDVEGIQNNVDENTSDASNSIEQPKNTSSNEDIVKNIEKSYLDITKNKIKDPKKSEEEQKKIEENLDFIIKPYLIRNENETYIDIFALQKDYKNHEVFLNYVNDINMILRESEVSFRSLKFRFYGNWCGLGHPASNKNPRAIDSIDARCRTHDLCYRKYGHKCHCDTQLRNSMRALLPKIKGAYKRGVAQAIIAAVPYMMKGCKK